MRVYGLSLFVLVALSALGDWSSAWAGAPKSASVEEILYFKEKEQEDIYIRLSGKVDYRVFALSDPVRLVIEVPVMRWNAQNESEGRPSQSIVKAVRFGQYDNRRARLVFDLNAKPLNMNHRYFLDGKTGRPFIQVMLKTPVIEVDESSESVGSVVDENGLPNPRMKPRNADFSTVQRSPPKSSQKYVIAVDAGHGDQDPGAIGPGGTQEKSVTLRYAKALKEALERTGRYKVVLTRDRDRFIRLRDRIKIAREAKANLFISLHADSAPGNEARGLSVYTVSEKASDEESARLADKENSSDVIAGFPLADTSEDVANILIDLAQRETKTKSSDLAGGLVKQLDKKVRLLENSHRFAGFAVLKAPDIPSVLVETGFLSNPKEERLLNSADYQKRVIQGIVNGVDSYFEKNRK